MSKIIFSYIMKSQVLHLCKMLIRALESDFFVVESHCSWWTKHERNACKTHARDKNKTFLSLLFSLSGAVITILRNL